MSNVNVLNVIRISSEFRYERSRQKLWILNFIIFFFIIREITIKCYYLMHLLFWLEYNVVKYFSTSRVKNQNSWRKLTNYLEWFCILINNLKIRFSTHYLLFHRYERYYSTLKVFNMFNIIIYKYFIYSYFEFIVISICFCICTCLLLRLPNN